MGSPRNGFREWLAGRAPQCSGWIFLIDVETGYQAMTDLFAMRVTVPEDTLINVIEAESVLLNLKSERYFGLDEVGTRMWQVMTTAGSLQQAFETLSGEYAVEPDVLRRDMEDLIGKLTEHGLLELSEPGPVEGK